MASAQGNTILHNLHVGLHLIVIALLAILLVVTLMSCGSGEESWLKAERYRAYKTACLEYGYPDYWVNIDTKVVFCLKRSECTDEVVRLSDLRKRGQ